MLDTLILTTCYVYKASTTLAYLRNRKSPNYTHFKNILQIKVVSPKKVLSQRFFYCLECFLPPGFVQIPDAGKELAHKFDTLLFSPTLVWSSIFWSLSVLVCVLFSHLSTFLRFPSLSLHQLVSYVVLACIIDSISMISSYLQFAFLKDHD